MLDVRNGLLFTKASASCVGVIENSLAKLIYLRTASIEGLLLYLVNQSPYNPSLESAGVPSAYLPVSMPNPSGEYAKSPTFSR